MLLDKKSKQGLKTSLTQTLQQTTPIQNPSQEESIYPPKQVNNIFIIKHKTIIYYIIIKIYSQ